ncbi:MAG: hypothetical protein M3Q87_04495 [Actinomycetota bacterium]|nr:hypothetical protein [Actinomycetota bacterium]
MTMPPSRIKLRGIRPALKRHSFVVRWGAAVAMSVLLTGWVEYVFASHQLEQRLLEQAADTHLFEAQELEEALAEAPTPSALRRTLDDTVADLAARTGLLYVGVFDADGALLSAAGESGEPDDSADHCVSALGGGDEVGPKALGDSRLGVRHRPGCRLGWASAVPLQTSWQTGCEGMIGV